MIMGESIPILKIVGGAILGGTVCVKCGSSDNNKNAGAAFVTVTGVSSSTALACVVCLIKDAQTNAFPIQNLTDYISSTRLSW